VNLSLLHNHLPAAGVSISLVIVMNVIFEVLLCVNKENARQLFYILLLISFLLNAL